MSEIDATHSNTRSSDIKPTNDVEAYVIGNTAEEEDRLNLKADIEAKRLLDEGDPYRYFLKTCSEKHEGDLTPARCTVLTFGSSCVANGDGLHVFISGNSGTGKSHLANEMMQQLPDRYRYNKPVSDKHLYYAGMGEKAELFPGCVVLIDDQSMSPEVQELFKRSSSNYHEDMEYGTVQNQKSVTVRMPKEVSFILLKVDDVGDDQCMNRLIQAQVDESKEKIEAADRMIKSKYCNLTDKNVSTIRWSLRVCRYMWQHLKSSKVAVEVPYAQYVRFVSNHNLRTHELFFNLVMSHAAIFQNQRKEIGKTLDNIPIIEATYDDYKEAKYIFDALHVYGGQAHNTLKSEDAVIDAILELNPEDSMFTIHDIAPLCGLSYNTIYTAFKGRKSTKGGDNLGGLLQKCPYIQSKGKRTKSDLDQEYTTNPHGQTIKIETISRKSYNEEIYSVDLPALIAWSKKGSAVDIDGRAFPVKDTPNFSEPCKS